MNATPSLSLTVIAPHALYELSVPAVGGDFSEVRFFLLPPEIEESPPEIYGRGSTDLTVIFGAEAYTATFVASLSGSVWLWFTVPLSLEDAKDLVQAPLLRERAREETDGFQQKIERFPLSQASALIVGDRPSQEFLSTLGFESFISPPPVNDDVFSPPKRDGEPLRAGMVHHGTSYESLYLDEVEDSIELHFLDTLNQGVFRRKLGSLNVGVNIHPSPLRIFPFVAALHLARGHTLVSEPLNPLHGLEPGIDYFEVTSPSELRHVLGYLSRSPDAGHLMAFRGHQKSRYFTSSKVFRRLIQLMPGRSGTLVRSSD
jgi:hypothetical protein